jgi:hypothetical protein
MNEQEALGYSVYLGIDWADSKHDVCIQPKNSDEREQLFVVGSIT